MQPDEFLEVASSLATTSNATPADIRTAISRAYYATYHVAFDLLCQIGLEPSTGHDAHKDLRNLLRNSGHYELRSLAGTLSNLQGRRVDADYHLDRKDVERPKVATAIVEQARSAIKDLRCHLTGNKREEIRIAMKKWRGTIGIGSWRN